MNKYIGLIFACPSNSRQTNCPFKSFREMEKEKAFEVWQELTCDQKEYLISQHKICLHSCKKDISLTTSFEHKKRNY